MSEKGTRTGLRRALLVLALQWLTLGQAAAEIIISPLRQVITPQAPLAVFEISNPADRIIDVKTDWIDMRALAEGYAIASPDERRTLSAAPYLTVSPAFVRLEPGERATVTIKLQPGVAPPPGERRSHLLFTSDVQRTPVKKAGGLQADIGLGVSAPVILRRGRTDVEANFFNTALVRDEDGDLVLETHVERRGAHSTFGRLVADFAPANDYAPLSAWPKVIDNATIHVDAPPQNFALPLNIEALPTGRLTLRYEGRAEYAGIVFAEKVFEIAAPSE